ncbi:MAG: AAA family ATPase [Gammaproteobacteria bacterium]|nr:AAA family ATPase [Gammaproteobacteria bacterium]MCF6261781.1 AAA family ATPase [Gammaproteobacteria bacterium]
MSIKTVRPSFRHVYFRERVFNEIDQQCDYPMIWVEGQPGCGKTTLISSYLEKINGNYLWYRISESDNNLVEFLYRFSSALSDFLPKSSQSLRMLSLPFQPEPESLFKSMFKELHQNISPPFYLIFDDFHLISNNDFHNMLVEALIPMDVGNINIFIISRHKPADPYSRLRARQKFSRLGKKYLDWSEDEVIALTQMLSDDEKSKDLGKAFFEITHGWVSGVILLIEMLKEKSSTVSSVTLLDKSFLFEYFASEIFSSMSETTQKLLIKASFFNEVDVKQRKFLLDKKRLKTVLEELCNRNYFVNDNYNNKSVYTFHPLFKEFLQKKSFSYFSKDELNEFRNEMAHSLCSAAHYERAIELYLKASNWEKAAHIIIQQADILFSQGKMPLILHWIKQFNKDAYNKYTWLHYWEAMCYLATDQNKSYSMLLNIFKKFQQERDLNGEYYTICSLLESIVFSFNYYDRLIPWIDIVTEKYNKNIKPKNIVLQVRLAANMHTALLFSNPTHKDLEKWEKNVCYLMKVLKITLNNDHCVLVGINLFYQYLWSGEKSKAEKIIKITHIDKFSGTSNPVSQGAWYVMVSVNAWMNGDANKAKQAADDGLKVAEESGIYFWFDLLLLQKTYACLINMELEEAQGLLTIVARRENADSQLIASMYYDAYSQWEYLQGDLDSALEHKKLCMIEINKMTMPYAIPGYRLGLAEIQIARGEYKQAKDSLILSRKECEKMRSDIYLYRCSLLESQLSIETGNNVDAIKHMTVAMGLAEFRGFESHPWWNAKNISLLYEFALKENINTDYVIHCIKKRNLQVNIHLIEYENWDWPVKIYTFGSFRIIINHILLPLTGKSQRKPLILLKALLSFGMWRISQSHLAGRLWPEADGPESLQALYVNTHRLRRLLGTKSILVKDGYIGLNPEIVWVDAGLATYYVAKLMDALHKKPTVQKKSKWGNNLLNLYAGKFLESEQDDVWCFQYSEELHNKVLTSLKLYAGYLSEQHQYEKSLALLKRITQLDILDEKIYQDQITLLISLKRYPEAITVYNECRSLLSRVLGVMPSATLSSLLKDELHKEKTTNH